MQIEKNFFAFIIFCFCFSRADSQSHSLQHPVLELSSNCGFIENNGQIKDQDGRPNHGVKYILPLDNGLNVQVRANGISYDSYVVEQHTSKNSSDPNSLPLPYQLNFHRVDIDFLGSSLHPQIVAEEIASNYRIYSGADRESSLIVHQFARIRYIDLYPGIDLLLESVNSPSGKAFEYYFVIRPGADPAKIKIRYKGAKTYLQKDFLAINLRQGEIREKIPSSYLLENNDRNEYLKVPGALGIMVTYKVTGNNTYGFTIPCYDRKKTLVIDPTPGLVWGTYYGSALNDGGRAITRDNIGNIIVGGNTDNSNNIATIGAYQTSYGGNSDAILGKFQADGTLLWMTYFGSAGMDLINAVTTDNNNDIFIAGMTESVTGIVTPGTHQSVKAFGIDGFIAKFSATGIRTWGTYYGGEEVEFIHSIKVDPIGNVFVAGWTHSTTGIATAGSYQPVYAGGILNDAGDAFLARFTSTGNRQWATYYGGASFDRFYDMDLDNNGYVYAAGITYSTAGIASAGSFQPVFGGGIDDAFLVKFDISGNRQWATYYGGPAEDYAASLVVDNGDHITMSGMTISTTGIATTGTQQPAFGGGTRDAFIARFDPGGSRIWGTYLGGNGEEIGAAIAADATGNLFVTGGSYSSNNITTTNAYQTTVAGAFTQTIFLVKYNSSGIRQWGTYYGNSGPFGNGEGFDVVEDNSGGAFITGYTTFTNNISSCSAVQMTWAGGSDLFLAHFNDIPTTAPALTITASPVGPWCAGTSITFTATAVNAGGSLSYQWKVNGVNAGTNASTFTTSSLSNGDIVNCVATTTASPCITGGINIPSNNITVTIAAPVTPSLSITASATTICQGTTVNFDATATNAGSSPAYQWKINGLNVGPNNPSFSSSTLFNGDIVTCILTSSLSCTTSPQATSNSISMTVTSIIIPVINIDAPGNNVCPGTPVTLHATTNSTSGPVSYQWMLNGAAAGTNANNYTNGNFQNGDQLYCILSAAFTGCPGINVSSNTITIVIKDPPLLTLLPVDTTVFWGESVQLNASVTGPLTTFIWTPINSLDNPASLMPVATPSQTTIYHITAIGSNGCTTARAMTVTVLQNIFMPSAFTPNNNGENDIFRIPAGEAILLDEFSVYDRAGTRLFFTRNPTKGWDGKYLGAESPVGIYVYFIKGKTTKGNIQLKGTVALIR